MHVQTFLAANTIPYPPPSSNYPFNPIPSTNFVILPGTVETNSDGGAPLAVNVPPYTNSTGSIIYDFGSWSPNWRMYHYGKIYYFKYKIFDNMGNVLADGYIKHKFYNDTDDSNNISDEWKLVAEVPSLATMYDVVVMYNQDWDEMCLTNKEDYSTNGYDPLLSSVDVVDPVTLVTYTLSFTSETNGIYVDFN